jgi:tetratricopeptide (TPR) repeat protein
MDLEAAWSAGQHGEGLAWCLERLCQDCISDPLLLRYALEFALELGQETALLVQFPDLTLSQNPEVQALLSLIAWQRGQLSLALETAQLAYQQSPGFLTAYTLSTAAVLRSPHEAGRWLREALRQAEAAGQPQRAVQAAAALALLEVTLGAYAQAEVWAGWGLRVAETIGLKHPSLRNTLNMAWGYAQGFGGRLATLPPLNMAHPDARLVQGDFLLALGQAEAALEAYTNADEQLPPIRARRLPILARKVRALLALGRLEEAQCLGFEAKVLGEETLDTFRDWGELAYLLPASLLTPSKAVEPLAELLGRFLRRPSAPRAAMTALYLAKAYLSLGLEAKARTTLAQASWSLEGLSTEGRALLAVPEAFFGEVFALLEPVPKLRLHFLGGETAWLEGAPLRLTPRHREILVALALHPAGLTAEQLALRVWGEGGRPEVAKAEVQRLRQQLPLASRPYRLLGGVWADFVTLRERLLQGNLEGALALFGGPLLSGSDAPVVLESREELWSLLKKTLLFKGSSQQAFELAMQEEDPEFWESVLVQLTPGDPRRALLETQLKRFWSNE